MPSPPDDNLAFTKFIILFNIRATEKKRRRRNSSTWEQFFEQIRWPKIESKLFSQRDIRKAIFLKYMCKWTGF